jgi:4-amino-4-deoxy-L-arabinose transferase-like glycosyltransferase
MSIKRMSSLHAANPIWINRLWIIFAILLLAAFSLFIQIRWSPAIQKVHVDGTFFGYGGARILDGDLPYVDFWDHKPPGIFYLNALAFWLMGTDAWSLWYLALFWTFAVALSFYLFLRRLIPQWYALLCSTILLATLPIYNEGLNLTEFYALLPSVFALIFTYHYFSRGRKYALIGLGGAFAAAALLKHTNFGTALACIGTIAYVEVWCKGIWRAIRSLWGIALLPVLTLITIVVYWGYHGAILDLWQATVVYNITGYVSGASFIKRIYGTARTIAITQPVGALFIVAFGATIAHWFSRSDWKDPQLVGSAHSGLGQLAADWTYVACFAAMFTEVIFISLAGRGYSHYYITLLPALCASVSYWFWISSPAKTPSHSKKISRRGIPPTVIAGLLVWTFVIFGIVRPSPSQVRTFFDAALERRPLRTNVGKYVVSHTDPNDSVLVWDIGAEVNFETGRRSPSRYLYFHHLFRGENAQRWDNFLSDLNANEPALIIIQWQAGYAPNFDVPVDELASSCNCDGEILAGFTAFSQYVKDNYDRQVLFDETFAVYSRKSP